MAYNIIYSTLLPIQYKVKKKLYGKLILKLSLHNAESEQLRDMSPDEKNDMFRDNKCTISISLIIGVTLIISSWKW